MSFEILRWATLHPAVVHLPLGTLPLAFVVYALAYVRRNEALAFAADVILWAGAFGAVLAAGFGIVSYAMASWPGGMGPWPAIHLTAGLTTAVASVLAVLYRGRHRKAGLAVRPGDVGIALGVTVLVLFTGWVGGQALVFHAGMAVEAGGRGSLAPHFGWSEGPPGGLMDAMGRLRSAWGSLVSTAALSVVQQPNAVRYASMARDAGRIAELAHVMSTDLASRMTQDNAERAQKFQRLAQDFEQHAGQLGIAAGARDLPGIQAAIGTITADCARCHEKLRWRAP